VKRIIWGEENRMRHFSFLRTQYLRACPTRANSCGMTVSDHSSSTCWYEHVRLLGKYSVSDLISSLADTDSQELELDDVEESVDCASDQISQEVIYDENEAGPSNRENPSPTIETNFQLGDFVIVKFATNKNDRFFIARIDGKNESDSDFTVIALRKKQCQKQLYFVYPNIEDISNVPRQNIVKIVKGKADQKGRFIFTDISGPVLIVRGLHGNWKQPLAYHFVNSSCKGNLLKDI
jgi:hypothetical protein